MGQRTQALSDVYGISMPHTASYTATSKQLMHHSNDFFMWKDFSSQKIGKTDTIRSSVKFSKFETY
jgi:hypothetical protein